MNIYLKSVSNFAISLFKESVVPSLTTQQKKILTIASIAFAALAVAYAIKRYLSPKVMEEGQHVKGKLEGQGKRTYPDGRVEEGNFHDDKLNGEGKIFHPCLCIKNGEIQVPAKKENGWVARLAGEFKNGKLNGKGKVVFYWGVMPKIKYEGEFNDGKFIKGKIFEGDGEVLEGEFEYGELRGHGKITCADKIVYEGEFKNHNLFQGKRIYPDGKVIEGWFKDRILISGKI